MLTVQSVPEVGLIEWNQAADQQIAQLKPAPPGGQKGGTCNSTGLLRMCSPIEGSELGHMLKQSSPTLTNSEVRRCTNYIK